MRLSSSLIVKIDLVILLLMLSFCKGKESYHIKPTIVNLKSIIIDTSLISIPVEKNTFFIYKIASVTSTGTFCGYNPQYNRLDIYDLNQQKVLKYIQLPTAGTSGINNVLSVSILNIDSIFVLTRTQISLFDSKGTILKTVLVNTNKSYFRDNYCTEFDYGNNFTYNTKNKKLLITNVDPKAEVGSLKRFNTPFITEADFDNPQLIRQLPVEYSPLYHENYYGFMVAPQFSTTSDGNAIIFNFPIEPNIYKYDFTTGKTVVFGGKPISVDTGNNFIANSLDSKLSRNDDKKLLHYIENCNYYKVIPDQNGKGYYRIHNTPMQYMTTTGDVNDFSHKKRYLSIFDNNFNLINNLSLNDRNYALQGAFTTTQGFYLPVLGNDNVIMFKLFKFKNH